jgi:Flp pilus assembly protein TadD
LVSDGNSLGSDDVGWSVPLYEAFRSAEERLADRDPLGALALLEPLLDAASDEVSVQLLAARAYFDSAQLRRAEGAFRRVVELDPSDHYARYGLGRTLERINRREEAATHYRMAAAMDPRVEYAEALWRVTS